MRILPASKVPIAGASGAHAAELRKELRGLLAQTDRHDVQKSLARLLRASQAEWQLLTLARARVLRGLGQPTGPPLPPLPSPVPVAPVAPPPAIIAKLPLPEIELQAKLASLTATLEDFHGYSLRQAERAIATQPMEYALVFRGGKLVFYKERWLPDQVQFSEAELKSFAGGVSHTTTREVRLHPYRMRRWRWLGTSPR